MVIAAEIPDLDILWSADGPIAAFQHHRGWTHAFIGLPLEAAVVVGAFWLFHRWRTQRKNSRAPESPAPIRWGLLYVFAFIALASHILLDWTNNYGVRPFFPFNPRWYSGSFVFIFEPVMFAALLIGLLAPPLFSLINSEVGVRRTPFSARGWPIAALLAIVTLWGWRLFEQQKALQLATDADLNGAAILRVATSPHPITPFRWHVVLETPQYFQLATADTLTNTLTTNPADIIYKPPTTIATLIAKQSWLGEAYLDWSQFPLVVESPQSPEPDAAAITTVTFRDLRFMYDVSFMKGREHPPLSGTVYINADHRITGMTMDGHTQK
jgi:inner membrane protein